MPYFFKFSWFCIFLWLIEFACRLLDKFLSIQWQAKIFHYGSISLITEPCKSAHIAAAKAAKDAGVIVSYDPNLRLPLWPSADSAREGILNIWETADIIKVRNLQYADNVLWVHKWFFMFFSLESKCIRQKWMEYHLWCFQLNKFSDKWRRDCFSDKRRRSIWWHCCSQIISSKS